MTSSPTITVDGLRKEYGAVTALDGLDLELSGPQILGVAGPNGSGKTTLIQTLLGLLAPTGGTATVNGTAPAEFDAPDRRRLGYMPQHTAVYDDLSVRENVAFFAKLYDVADRAQAVDDAIAFVDLADRADARVDELSGGMIRRTSLACAIVHDPEVLFLDEPTVGLDPELRASMWDGFRTRRANGSIVLVSTHYLGEARNCDRVLFLREGRVLALDSPDGFLAATATDDMEAAFLALLEDAKHAGTAATPATSGGGKQ
jgi:ABC-2 type transport system ATP-binding protein